MHGSCFSLKGDGTSMMPALDDIIGDALAPDTPPKAAAAPADADGRPDLRGRPRHVPAARPELDRHQPPRRALTETVPIPAAVPASRLGACRPDSLPAGRRLKLVRVTAGMTSDDGDDHLIGFGEFAAMYLLAWTGRLKGGSSADQAAVARKTRGPAGQHASKADTTGVARGPRGPGDRPGRSRALLTPLFAPAGAARLRIVRDEVRVTRRPIMQRPATTATRSAAPWPTSPC